MDVKKFTKVFNIHIHIAGNDFANLDETKDDRYLRKKSIVVCVCVRSVSIYY